MAGTFSINISKFISKTNVEADKVVRKVCLDLMTGVILKTPVDTGRARANWQASIDKPASGTISFSADAGSSKKAPSASAGSASSIGDGMGAVSQATGRVFWLVNNLPYIYRLEYGAWSKQAPHGMVRTTIAEIQRKLT
jgi:hypothetical protein